MCRLVKSILIFLAFFIDQSYGVWKDYKSVLESDEFKDTIGFIAPQKLIENHEKLLKSNRNVGFDYNCGRDLAIVQEALVQRKLWAIKMVDASSKIPSGLLEGNIVDLGMYDECIAVEGESLGIKIHGRHCMYSISATQGNVTLPLNPTLSICVPTSCTADDIADLFNGTIGMIDKLKDLKIKIASASCASTDTVTWDTGFIVCTSILLTLLGFLIICTICDLKCEQLDAGDYRNPVLKTLAQFSLKKSSSSILSLKVKEGTLPAIHGIRFLSMAWVVLGHEHVLQVFGVTVNNVDIFNWIQSWKSLYIFIAPFAVDTFFTMSGFLMTYLFLKQIPKQRRFNVPMYYLHRFFRLTPAVAALILFVIFYAPKLGSGARWDMIMNISMKDTCSAKWWPFLLYLQNFVDKENMCLVHLWYLAVEMQLFWISPIVLYPLYKKPKLGLIMLVALFLASLTVPASIIGVRRLPVMSFTHDVNISLVMDVFMDVYEMPYNRAGPWIIGIYLGYEVVNYNRRLGKLAISAGWLLATLCFAFCTFGTRSFMDPTYVYHPAWETFFATVSRPVWAIGICWIIYASIKGYAGPISTFLSCPIFLPLSRLSYCVYLLHMVIQIIHAASLRTPTYFSEYYVWRSFFSTLMITLVSAFFFSLLFESPVMVLEKVLLKKNRQPQYESQKDLRASEDEESRTQN